MKAKPGASLAGKFDEAASETLSQSLGLKFAI